MFDEIKFTEATRKLVDCDYSLCDTSKGFGCLTMILQVYREMGYRFPDEWNGWTESNFAERWEKGDGRKEFIEFLNTLGEPVQTNFVRPADLIIFEDGPGIYLSGGNVIRIYAGNIEGGKVLPFRLLKRFVVGIRRLV